MLRIRIQHFRLNTDPDPGFLWPKIEQIYSWKFFLYFFWSRNTMYLFLGLHKGHPSYKRSPQLSKENIQHFKTWNFLIFSYLCGSLLHSWIRTQINWPDWIRIRIRSPECKGSYWSSSTANVVTYLVESGPFWPCLRPKPIFFVKIICTIYTILYKRHGDNFCYSITYLYLPVFPEKSLLL